MLPQSKEKALPIQGIKPLWIALACQRFHKQGVAMQSTRPLKIGCQSTFLALVLILCTTPSAFSQWNRSDDRYKGWFAGVSYSSIRSPILFTADQDSRDEFALPQTGQTIGLSAGYEIIRRKAGFSIGLLFYPASFETSIQPRYEVDPEGPSVSFQDPKYTLFLFDIAVQWTPSVRIPVALLGVFDLGFSVESYDISGANTAWESNQDGHKSRGHGQVGFGLGSRIFLTRTLSISARYTWIIGEGKEEYEYDHEDENYIYYKSAGYDIKGPTGLFVIGIVLGLNPSEARN